MGSYESLSVCLYVREITRSSFPRIQFISRKVRIAQVGMKSDKKITLGGPRVDPEGQHHGRNVNVAR